MDSDDNTDLPLCSNTNDILARHYIFTLKCDMKKKIFSGSVSLNLSAIQSSKETSCSADSFQGQPFIMVLDCKDIEISKIEEVTTSEAGKTVYKELNFKLEHWSLKIWKENSCCQFCFPQTIIITYKTTPAGKSLLWVKDQDLNACVYTYGAWINNRSLFPCQEPPNAMATWEASVTVPESLTVLMSGDEFEELDLRNGFKEFRYKTKSVLPMATLAIAVGSWKSKSLLIPDSSVKCRIFSTSRLLPKFETISWYIIKCIEIAEFHMTVYPFPRVDFLVVPKGFGSLGMASPNLVFLSQSTLTSTGTMNVRISHEISHSWFGLLIGAKDWTEEWLSEGFATFLEDVFHTATMNWDEKFANDYKELRCWIRLKTLRAEVENTQDELQTLRPTQGKEVTAEVDHQKTKMVKNGMNTEKAFIQVHYIKGYFLLKYLCKLVTEKHFMEFLRQFVETNKGKLIDSREFLEQYFTTFQSIRHETVDSLINDWLDTPGIPKKLEELVSMEHNSLYNNAVKEVEKIERMFKNCKSRKRRNCDTSPLSGYNCNIMLDDQLVVILELLLDSNTPFSSSAFKHVVELYSLRNRNPEVRHRWCELIVKHRWKSMYSDVKHFLETDLAMGIYLYGELINSNVLVQKKLAEECFLQTKDDMEPNYQIEIIKMFNTS